ncbi:hypothetical protein D9758_004651 [Tetrapyrgos nigripes]|uniref:Uncharacterized protein n=1 Tax=Tetrapyrgos nigripes TaxID=182062 RepID=A0A8H5LYR5_9AGAR|nr:hypothetical protein D9758_004651 [Tetrapyrgos nigripes]
MVMGYGMAVGLGHYFWLILILQCLTLAASALHLSLPNGPTPTVTVGEQATAIWVIDSDNDKSGFSLLLNCDTNSDDNLNLDNSSVVSPTSGQTQGEISRKVTQAGNCHFEAYQLGIFDPPVKLGGSAPLLAVASPQAQAQPPISTPTQISTQDTTAQASSTTSPARTPTPESKSSETSSSTTAGGVALGSKTSRPSATTIARAQGSINPPPPNDPNSTSVTNFSTSTATTTSPTSSLEPNDNGQAKKDTKKIILGSVFGVLSLAILILVCVFFIIRRRRRSLQPGFTVTPFLDTSRLEDQPLNRRSHAAGLGNPSPTIRERAHRKFKTSKTRDTNDPEQTDSSMNMPVARAEFKQMRFGYCSISTGSSSTWGVMRNFWLTGCSDSSVMCYEMLNGRRPDGKIALFVQERGKKRDGIGWGKVRTCHVQVTICKIAQFKGVRDALCELTVEILQYLKLQQQLAVLRARFLARSEVPEDQNRTGRRSNGSIDVEAAAVPEFYVDSGWRMPTVQAQGDDGEAELRCSGVVSI